MERWRRHIAEGRLAAVTGDMAALDAAKRAAKDVAAELEALGRSVAGDLEAANTDAGVVRK